MDFDDDVLYCYEIQLEESLRRKGIGRVTFLYLSHFYLSFFFLAFYIVLLRNTVGGVPQEERNR